jgi:hypothetical protein
MGSEDGVLVSAIGSMFGCLLIKSYSFAGTGFVSVAIAWFILPEVTRRTPGEIDEL